MKVTKIELLKLRKKLKVMKRVLKILKSKRDKILHMLGQMMNEGKEKYEDFSKAQDSYFKMLKEIFLNNSFEEIEIDSRNLPDMFEIIINKEKIMGHEVRNFELKFHEFSQDYYIFIKTDFNIIKNFLSKSIELANIVEKINVLMSDLKDIHKKINFLEKILVPETEDKIRYIENFLAEREKEEMIRLKMIKNKRAKFSFI
jgi:V/A-type H+-transporting ATPase subunit D